MTITIGNTVTSTAYSYKGIGTIVNVREVFSDKEESIKRIAIDNIRSAYLRDLEHDKQKQHEELQQKRAFVPSIRCEQIAYLEFV